MRKSFFTLLTVILILDCFCVFGSFGRDANSQNRNISFEDSHQDKTKKRIELKVNLKEQRELQNAVDNGHQPWRLDPIFVAYVEAGPNVDKSLKCEDCRIKSERNAEAEVTCKGVKNYIVELKRLIKPAPDGIWTAISI